MTSSDPDDTARKQPTSQHTLADHRFGAFADHVHDSGYDHDHDHDHEAMDGLLIDGMTEHVVLTSIGIDVGSSGTQVALSRLHLERVADSSDTSPTGRLSTGKRETLYQSPIALTPYAAGDAIDDVALRAIVDHAFAAAGLHPDDIDCGVVILTGAARVRSNAEAITERLAIDCGDIVSAAAGHHLEARLAAYGSGAVERCRTTRGQILNIDIGGSTTKLAVCADGAVVATAALEIGGRPVSTTADDVIDRLDPVGARHARRAGFDWHLGGPAPFEQRKAVGRMLADDLIAALIAPAIAPEVKALFLTEPFGDLAGIDGVMVSGGVGEYVYARERRSFGDIGLPLGRALAARLAAGALPWPLLPSDHCIRATVLGASAFSVQLSGRTGLITEPGQLLPRRNLPVVQPPCRLSGEIDPAAVAAAVRHHLAAFDIASVPCEVVLAFRWAGPPAYHRLRAFAEGLSQGLAPRRTQALPTYLMIDGDIALTLGHILQHELGFQHGLLVLDGIALNDFDFVDLGRIRLPSATVPVTIKTLVFRNQSEQPGTGWHGASDATR